jgi:hypothetical protein
MFGCRTGRAFHRNDEKTIEKGSREMNRYSIALNKKFTGIKKEPTIRKKTHKIPFETDFRCHTKCPYVSEAWVDSAWCKSECGFFIKKIDKGSNGGTLYCNHPEDSLYECSLFNIECDSVEEKAILTKAQIHFRNEELRKINDLRRWVFIGPI